MQLKFYLNYFTKPGENLVVVINGKTHSMCYTGDGCWFAYIDKIKKATIEYYYIVVDDDGSELANEFGKIRKIDIEKNIETYEIHDLWQGIDDNRSFYSSAFTEIVNKRKDKKTKEKSYNKTLEFRVNAPQISPEYALAIIGNQDVFENWEQAQILNSSEFPLWAMKFDAAKISFPFEFKFVLVKLDDKTIVEWESGENRKLFVEFNEETEHKIHTLHCNIGSEKMWRGAGTAVPVFSLRSKNSFGIGDFVDLKKMVDWVKTTNQVVLQTLPINDTCMYFDKRDSYPYRANSIYALHPVYISLSAMGKLPAAKQKKYNDLQKKLNALSVVDYDKVIETKWNFFAEIFEQDGEMCLKSADYNDFFERNEFWLTSYAMFCVLRDKFKTPDFHEWKEFADFKKIDKNKFQKEHKKSLQFYYFLQYHADKQMREAAEYARKNGVILKGDIPIGISRDSVEAWVEPQYFNMNSQAGAPPDDFSVDGQNWGFPTYNWDAMREDRYIWWIRRFQKMADYFDAYRIDHILGFFRIWEIPLNSVQGLLGYFNPALPYSRDELAERGLPMNENRFLKPYIRCHFLGEIFGEYDDYAYKMFFNQIADDILELKPEFDSQRKVEKYFAKRKDDKQTQALQRGLYTLINNVLFVEDPVKKNHFHPRITAQLSITYRELDDFQKQIFNQIYDEFYYHRNTDFWKSQAMEKLPMLIGATDMLVCGEDLGMIPQCVPEVMNNLQILSLEIQRMPKDIGVDFANPAHYPYRSVCTTSTHDMSPLRAWWKENRELTQRYFNSMLQENDTAPEVCSGNIVEKILVQHLNSPAMLAILPLQDWLGIDEKIRRANEDEERINVPANPNNYWQYRMHLAIEELLKEKDFNEKVKVLSKR